MSSEFSVIQDCFVALCQNLPAGDLGIGDDAAVLSVPENHQVVVATDTLVQGIHFPENTPPEQIAWKALAVNLSDLAAMGASPWCYSLSLSVPKSLAKPEWFAAFAKGLAGLCEHLKIQIPLIGGDTTSAKEGALSVTISAQGLVKSGKAIFRNGARAGDWIVVTENIGQGALGLQVAFENPNLESLLDSQKVNALKALNTPVPPIHLGQKLSGLATSAIDISDGLLQDLGHILRQSSYQDHSVAPSQLSNMNANHESMLGAVIDLGKLPVSQAMKAYIERAQDWSWVLSGGDDYQLCFTIKPSDWNTVQALAKGFDVKVTCVGKIINRPVLELVSDSNREVFDWQMPEKLKFGFQHF